MEKITGEIEVVRTKTAVQDFLEQIISCSEIKSKRSYPFLFNFDAMYTLLKILEFCARENIKLSDLVAETPEFFIHKKEVAVPWRKKSVVIRSLIEEKSENTELTDSIKFYHTEGWALVLLLCCQM
ncbi:hypothetical protein M1M88_01610 [Peptococcaceae bacterium]|nr:hypothetical protein [Peptococcaceae bacterium]MCL0052617.1 hypothetical protein [Peptococcaceae bacterium]